ncbi:MAG: methyltransferase domain-containing protein [Rhodocyclaceae bacterium]|nr:methyltransferase domain-containing protein [Rhodocyclaceae bacterium]
MSVFHAIGFSDWLSTTPQGSYILDWEQRKLDQILADIFGFNALQIGLPVMDTLRANRMPFRFFCDADESRRLSTGSAVRSEPTHLPFANNSMDTVVLPHILEFSENPHQILREVERVLMPEGSVIVTGFNPWSLWGAHCAFTQHPWCANTIGVPRLRDWFYLLGLETRAGAFGCYAPPFTQGQWLKRWKFMELAGNRWWPATGAVYVLQAIKRQQGMKPILPTWQKRQLRPRILTQPSAAKTPV